MNKKCKYLSNISDVWIREKLDCINPNERELVRNIQYIFICKYNQHNPCFTVDEFALFLTFKGLARSAPAFKEKYNGSGIVESVTSNLFTSKLNKWSFKDTGNASLTGQILDEIQRLFDCLQTLDYVKDAVASACLALCFPELCCTADYIVPAMLHNEYDYLNTTNPLFYNATNKASMKKALILPLSKQLTPNETRMLAMSNYRDYIQELWQIKRVFGLSDSIQQIESALWSFGICYCHKQFKGKDKNNRNIYYENRPLSFSNSPAPPQSGVCM